MIGRYKDYKTRMVWRIKTSDFEFFQTPEYVPNTALLNYRLTRKVGRYLHLKGYWVWHFSFKYLSKGSDSIPRKRAVNTFECDPMPISCEQYQIVIVTISLSNWFDQELCMPW